MAANFLSTGLISVDTKSGKEKSYLIMLADPALTGLVFSVPKITNSLYRNPVEFLAENGYKPQYKIAFTDTRILFDRLDAMGKVDTKDTLSVDDKGIEKLIKAIEKQTNANPLLLKHIVSNSDMANIAGLALQSVGATVEQSKAIKGDFLASKQNVVKNEIALAWGIDNDTLALPQSQSVEVEAVEVEVKND